MLLLNITQPNQKTWVSELKDMFNSLGLGYIWNLQKVQNENEFLKLFKQRLVDIYKQDWTSELSNSSDGRLYKFLKTKHEFESYLNLPKHLGIAIAKIRMSSHIFLIERGRWLKIERKKRVCDLCQTIEDEFHIFLECPRFNDERKDYIPTYLTESRSMFNFIKFLNTNDATHQKNLGYLSYKLQTKYKKLLLA